MQIFLHEHGTSTYTDHSAIFGGSCCQKDTSFMSKSFIWENSTFGCRKCIMKSYAQIAFVSAQLLFLHENSLKSCRDKQTQRFSKAIWYIFVKTLPSVLSSFSLACRLTNRPHEVNTGTFLSCRYERTQVRLTHYIVSSTKTKGLCLQPKYFFDELYFYQFRCYHLNLLVEPLADIHETRTWTKERSSPLPEKNGLRFFYCLLNTKQTII